jgi:hypothetical protein
MEAFGSGAARTERKFVGRRRYCTSKAEEEAIEERLELAALGEVVRGSEHADERAGDRRGVVVENPLRDEREKRVQDGAVPAEHLVHERELRLGKLVRDDACVAVLLERLEGNGTEELLRCAELREQALEVAAAEGLCDCAHDCALCAAWRADDQGVLASEDRGERAVDDFAPLGEAGREVQAKLLQLREGRGSGHGLRPLVTVRRRGSGAGPRR